MTAGGGSTTHAGILFQDSVAVLFLGQMLDPVPTLDARRIVQVRSEAPGPVDDVVLRYEDGHQKFVHVKKSVAFSSEPWRDVWRDFAARWRNGFTPGHDGLVLCVGDSSASLRLLRDVAGERVQGAQSRWEWWRGLSQKQQKFLKAHVFSHLSAGEQVKCDLDEHWQILAHLRVLLLPEEEMRAHVERQLPPCSALPATLFDHLLAKALHKAQFGGVFEVEALRRELSQEHSIHFVGASALAQEESQEAKDALEAYRARLIRELEFVSYGGIAGLGVGDRVVELPLAEVYAAPHLLPEREHAELSQREQVLVERLADPDLEITARPRLEVEHAEMASKRWDALLGQALVPHVLWPGAAATREEAAREPEVQDIAQVLEAHRQCVVLGTPGSGKSTLLRWLALECLRTGQEGALVAAPDGEAPFPVLVSLASYALALDARPGLALEAFLKEHVRSYGGPSLVEAFERRLARGRCWILLDGVDEVARGAQRATVVQRIEAWLPGCGENRCLLTSRPHGYNRVGGWVPHFHIGHFSPDHITRFVAAWHLSLARWQNPESPNEYGAGADARDLLAQIGERESITLLASNPLLLVVMALIYREKKRLPERRVELYDAIVNTLLDTWNHWRSTARHNAGGVALPRHHLLRVLAKVALWSRRDKPTGVLPRVELRREIVRALEEMELAEGDALATAQSYLNTAVEQAGILEERVPGVFAFWHPTFEEFLAARTMCDSVSRNVQQ